MDIDMNSSLVKEFIENKAGPKAYPIVKSLDDGVTDQEIKEEISLDDINQIRSILNRLHYLGIIRYDKEKAEDSNWYTYTWFLREERIKELLEEEYEEELRELEKKLDMRETHVFFRCENKCEPLPFEVAYEYDFQCPECEGKMTKADEDDIKEIKERVEEIKSLLGRKDEEDK